MTSPQDAEEATPAAQQAPEWEIRCVCRTEDDAGFMIQCDTCGVWQHGDCVHISQADVPEHYYCDFCERLLHEVRLGGPIASSAMEFLPELDWVAGWCR